MSHPDVQEAAIIGIPDAKWMERPAACVVLRENRRGQVEYEDIIDFLQGKVAKWWLPDKLIVVDEIPKTSVGKFDKKVLRQRYAGG